MANRKKCFWYEQVYEKIGRNYFDYDYTKGTKQEVDFIVDLLEHDHSQKILDVGCGPGRHSVELARRGFHVVGVDLSQRFLQIARDTAQSEHLDPDWVRADARHLAFKNSFDWAICLCEGAFGIMDSDEGNQKVLAAISSSLKPGGKLLLNVLNASFIFRHPENDENVDVKNCVGYWTEHYKTENGHQQSVQCSNRYYTFPEIQLRLQMVDMQALDAWGCIAGSFHKNELKADDFEFLVLAQKSTAIFSAPQNLL
ncbi:MAG: class I SAM-dependent methyltransferase [Calditrichaeota bacterium]|nr:class I SAM-dependent methyltransferase [Calditrichota bacterium]